MSEWRDITTAPADASMFLGANSFQIWPCVRLFDGTVIAVGERLHDMMQGKDATHWMPLPALPQPPGAET